MVSGLWNRKYVALLDSFSPVLLLPFFCFLLECWDAIEVNPLVVPRSTSGSEALSRGLFKMGTAGADKKLAGCIPETFVQPCVHLEGVHAAKYRRSENVTGEGR